MMTSYHFRCLSSSSDQKGGGLWFESCPLLVPVLFGLMLVLFLLSGCATGSPEQREVIDTPPFLEVVGDEPTAWAAQVIADVSAAEALFAQVHTFFQDHSGRALLLYGEHDEHVRIISFDRQIFKAPCSLEVFGHLVGSLVDEGYQFTDRSFRSHVLPPESFQKLSE